MTGVLTVRWKSFWFAPESAVNLALARVLVGVHALWVLLSRDYAAMTGVPSVFWDATAAAARWRYLVFPGASGLDALLQTVAVMALIAAVLGVAPRAACAVAGVLLYHLAPLETLLWNPGPTARGMTLAPVALLLLAAAPSGDSFALWPRTRAARTGRRSRRYGWALRLIQLQVVAIYLFSAIGKLQRTGLDWGSADRIRLWLLWFNQDAESVVFGTMGPWLAQFAWICGAIGVATFLLEWLMPVALIRPRTRAWFVAAALAFHVGILFTMNIHVPEAWLVVLLVDWSSLRRTRQP